MDIGFPKETEYGAHRTVIETGVIRENDICVYIWMFENFSYVIFYIFNYFFNSNERNVDLSHLHKTSNFQLKR